MAAHRDAIASALLDRYGRTYAEDAGIRLADQPAPLYQLLVLATLLSARISADIAVQGARELFAAGYRTPKAMQAASWPERVDALGRGHYKRYDERTATMLGQGAALLNERWRGDLRKLRDEADGATGKGDGEARTDGGTVKADGTTVKADGTTVKADGTTVKADGDARTDGQARRIASLLQEFPGIGPAGADIFLREVQGVWPMVAPYVDARVRQGARELGLPTDPAALAALAGSGGSGGSAEELARLTAALVRVTLSKDAAAQVKEAAQEAS